MATRNPLSGGPNLEAEGFPRANLSKISKSDEPKKSLNLIHKDTHAWPHPWRRCLLLNLIHLAHRLAPMGLDLSHDTLVQLDIRPPPQPNWAQTLAAGAMAGLVVDTSLYPIDTIKSRLQSKQGFIKAGGFSQVYRGLPPVLAGSIPNAAVFFITYETVKDKLHECKPFGLKGNAHALTHMLAASIGEVASCTVRVPYEVIKMRSQTADPASRVSNIAIFKDIIARDRFSGLYRGFLSTVMRDLPFSALQYPIWEKLKAHHLVKHKRPATAYESAYYGSIAGSVAAFLTTPLDVAKTRIMLADKSELVASGEVRVAIKAIYQERGLRGLFAGVVPRVIWISLGAAIFLGSYEQTIKLLSPD